MLFAILLTFIFGYFPATQVVGSEFNTANWTVRNFQYRREPFSHAQLTGVVRDKLATVLASNATFPNSYFNGKLAASSRWDLIEIRNGRSTTEGPAKILITYLQATSRGSDFWPDWSTKNPQKASVLWPAVRDLVDLELYNDLPAVIEMALVDCSDLDFQSTLREKMASIFALRCQKLKNAGLTKQSELADKLAEAYRDTP